MQSAPRALRQLGFALVTSALLAGCYGSTQGAGVADSPAYGLAYGGGPSVSGSGVFGRRPTSGARWRADAPSRHVHSPGEVGHSGVYDDHFVSVQPAR